MPIGWYGIICAYCFGPLTEENIYVDENGDKWDRCKECEEKERKNNGYQSEDA